MPLNTAHQCPTGLTRSRDGGNPLLLSGLRFVKRRFARRLFVKIGLLTLVFWISVPIADAQETVAEPKLARLFDKKIAWAASGVLPNSMPASETEYPSPVLTHVANFTAGAIDSFNKQGEVRLEQGIATVTAGSQISLPQKVGSWFRTHIDLQFGEISPGEHSGLQISFGVPGTIDQAVISFEQRCDASGNLKSRVSIYNWNPILKSARSFDIEGGIPDGKWLIECRYMSFSLRHELFEEHSYHAFANITFDSYVCLVDVQSITISALEKSCKILSWELEAYHPATELSRQKRRQLQQAKEGELLAIEKLNGQRSKSLSQRLEELAKSENQSEFDLQTQTTHEQAAEIEGSIRRALATQRELLGVEHPAYAESLVNLALLFRAMGNFVSAEPLYRDALAIQGRTLGRQHPKYASSLNGLAILYQSIGDNARAESLFYEAIFVREKFFGKMHPSYASSLRHLAALNVFMGNNERAELLVVEAMTIYEKVTGEKHPDFADCLNILACLRNDAGDKTRAISLVQEARTIYENSLGKEHPDYADCLSHLAVLYVSMGDTTQAEPFVREVLAIREKVLGKKHPDYANSLDYLGILYISMGDFVRAETMYREAFDTLLEHDEKTAAIQSESQQLQMARKLESCLANYLHSVAASKGSVDDAMVRALQWKGSIFFRQRLMRLARETDDPLIKAILAKMQTVASQVAALSLVVQHQSSQSNVARQKLTELNTEQEQLERELSEASAEFRLVRQRSEIKLADVLAAIPADAALVDIHRFRREAKTKNDYGLPEYESAYGAFILRPGRSSQFVDLGSKSEVDRQIELWRETFGQTQDVALDPGLALRQMLWVPVSAELDGVTTVLLSPDGATGTLPWAALPGNKPNSYLIDEYAFVTIPVPRLLPEIIKSSVDGSVDIPSMLLVGDVDYGVATEISPLADRSREAVVDQSGEMRHWQPLHDTRSEIVTIRDSFELFFPNGKAAIVRGDRATEKVIRDLAPQYRILHLATHGYFAPPSRISALSTPDGSATFSLERSSQNRPTGYHPGVLSGLVLAGANNAPDTNQDDGIFTALEFSQLDLRGADCVVLSACRTGLGSVAGGEGLLGLQRAFQIAGTRTTVASLWDVDSTITKELMIRFYEHMYHPDPTKRAASRIEALRRAQLSLLDNPGLARGGEDELADADRARRLPPRYWAAWVLSGDWR